MMQHRFVHTVSVEPYEGTGAFGPTYGSAVDVAGWVEQKRQLVRSDTGEEVVSSSTLHCAVDENIPPESRVTFNGRTTTALTVAVFDTAGMSPLDHQEVALA